MRAALTLHASIPLRYLAFSKLDEIASFTPSTLVCARVYLSHDRGKRRHTVDRNRLNDRNRPKRCLERHMTPPIGYRAEFFKSSTFCGER